MATQLVVRFGSTRHRFVANTQVQVSLGGSALKELAGSKLGEHHFDVSSAPVGSTLELLIRIPSPPALAAAGAPFVLEVKQNVEVIRLASGVISLRAHATSPGNRFTGGYHPRLEGHLVSSGAGHLYYLDLDNSFLHVTPLAGVVNPKFVAPYVAATPFPAGPPAHYNAKLFLYEYTKGRPSLWPVGVPPAVKPDVKTVHTVLFLRPIGDATVPYTNIDDASSTSLMRYLLDPVFGPFFVVTVPPSTAKKLTQIQNCGFERQVSEANKPVIFVSPQHHGSDYGDSANANWPKALQSLITALWAENHIGGAVATGLSLGNKALAGFSFGGVPLFAALGAHPKLVDELYLFDTKGFDAVALKKWFGLGGKRLRMVGGGFEHKAMLDLEAQLKTSAATTRPDSLDAWGTDLLYTSAVFITPLTASSAASAASGSLSARTGLFIGSRLGGIGFELQARSTSGTVIVPSLRLPTIGEEEFSAVLASYTECFADPTCKAALVKEFAKQKTTPPVVPVNTAADVTALVAAMVTRVEKTRHQWTVVGGRNATGAFDRGPGFRGFLQIAIEAGNFP